MRFFTFIALMLSIAAGAQAQERLLDSFDSTGNWQVFASDGVRSSVHGTPGQAGQGMRIDYDFGGAGGYAGARRKLPLDFEGDYEISFWLRADAPVNNLELKLVDASGDNVWWVNRPNFAISKEWQRVTFKKRHIEFAWGPAKDRTLRRTENVELVVSAGRDGGRGSLYIDQLSMRALAAPGPAPKPVLTASDGTPVQASLLDEAGQGWEGRAGDTLTVDFGQPREFGGVVLHWSDRAHAGRYDIAFSDDGINWATMRRVRDGDGGADPLLLAEAQTRFVRLSLAAGPSLRYRLARFEFKELGFGVTPNAFFQALAKSAPAGHYPRGMSGQQSYWTVLGVDGGQETGLLSEDGALEVARGGFSIEPFIVEAGKVVSWADVKIAHSLRERYLPIPTVTWTAPAWQLRTTAFARGTADNAHLVAQYEVKNTSAAPLALRLVLALRPFQVNPPMQFLNTPPGVSPIHDIGWDGKAFNVDGKPRVFALRAPDAAGVASFDAAAIPARIAGDGWSAARHVHDEFGFASGALAYDLELAPGATAMLGLVAPLIGAADLEGSFDAAWLGAAQDEVAALWRERLTQVTLRLPPAGQQIADTVRSSLAHMLMTRAGPMLMPGTRSYARSWIRDGAMMSEAMLRLGNDKVAHDYLEWYAPYQFADGKVPCCVDRRGADPVPENDSHGEFIFLAAQLWKYTQDKAQLERHWPRLTAAAQYMEAQRQSGRTAVNLQAARRSLYGLLPASISHEGYSAKPMHSYWDDFWGLRGYRDMADLAAVLGKRSEAALWSERGDEFERELLASLVRTAATHRINYLAGAAELGDFDPTSTTIALSPGGLHERLPHKLLHGTFERYWTEFTARRNNKRVWHDYTPYELRNVAAFVRLGWRTRAHDLLDFFMADRRPQEWNQWAEVVGRLPREPRFVGDMPHGWISSDFIRSALDLFAYQRESDQSLVLADGIPLAWLAGEGVAVRGLRTPYGPLSYSLKKHGTSIAMQIDATLALPRGGLVLRAFEHGWHPGHTTINGKAVRWKRGTLRIDALPASIIIAPRAPTIRPSISKARP